MTIDYKALVEKTYKEFSELVARRDEIELEIAKRIQFLRASVNMLPEEEKVVFRAKVEALANDYEVGITDAVRAALRSSPKEWNTATDVRDLLVKSGIDFSRYTSNPLASIHTILRRMYPAEVEKTDVEGVAAYRWKGRYGASNSLATQMATGKLGTRPRKRSRFMVR